MSPERWRKVKQLFQSAIELDGPARGAFVTEACLNDPEIATIVESMIAAHESDPSFLERPLVCTAEQLEGALGSSPAWSSLRGQSTETVADAHHPLSIRIGQYHIRRAIATGGMGTVYEATQENPRRVVALKLMKRGIPSRSALRRFKYESQILARLRHSGIAQVYEAGTHQDESGTTPFFAMEYIPNALPITEYAREKKLGTRERMHLFMQVCAAVHHGHQKGIIHRDLKPSNILVDSSGQVKVIDFGVARCTDSDLAVTTLQTDVGQLLGTLQYMSPEQCNADPHDIDIRSDVYALGVVLYELLIDRPPYNVTRMALHEATRIIREEQPRKLSTADKTLRGDAETIVLKALDKERERRYQSASALMADIEHYLKDQPISARPASAIYQFRKLVSRHKVPFAFLGALFLVISVFAVWMSVMYASADRLRKDAVSARDEAEQVVAFLTKTLSAPDPSKKGRNVTVREVLDQAANHLADFSDKPLVEARLRQTVGWTYRGLGLLPAAEAYLKDAQAIYARELGPENPQALRAAHAHAVLLSDMGDYGQAEALLRQTSETQRAVLGEEHPDTLTSMNSLAEVLIWTTRFAEAEEISRHTLAIRRRVLGEGHADTIESMHTLARSLENQGRYSDAETLFRQALEIQRRVLGDEHPDTLRTLDSLATNLMRQGRSSDAEAIDRRLYDVEVRVLGEEHIETLRTMNRMTFWLRKKHRYPEAEAMCRKMLEIHRRTLGEEHPDTLWSKNHLAWILYEEGRYVEAEPLFRQTLDSMRRVLGEGHIDTSSAMAGLAKTLQALKRYAEAETFYRKSLEIRRRVHGEGHPNTITAIKLLADDLKAQGRHAEAKSLLQEVREIRRRTLNDEHQQAPGSSDNPSTQHSAQPP